MRELFPSEYELFQTEDNFITYMTSIDSFSLRISTIWSDSTFVTKIMYGL